MTTPFTKATKFFLATLSMFIFSLPLYAASETFTFDPHHTYILWHVNHFGFSSPSGKWYVNGTVTLDKQKPQNSQVKATINVADLSTGLPELDDHLKGKLFLDVAHFPTATFVSNKVTVTGEDRALVQGRLTLHGVTKPITLKIKINKVGTSIITNKLTVGFTGSTSFKRSDFGIVSFLPGVADEVKIDIEAEANK